MQPDNVLVVADMIRLGRSTAGLSDIVARRPSPYGHS